MIDSIHLALIQCDTHVAPLVLWYIWVRHALLYTLRFSGAQTLEVSVFYRHIAPLERK